MKEMKWNDVHKIMKQIKMMNNKKSKKKMQIGRISLKTRFT